MNQMTSPQDLEGVLASRPAIVTGCVAPLQWALFAPGSETASIFTLMSDDASAHTPCPAVVDRSVLSLLLPMVQSEMAAHRHLADIEDQILECLDDERVLHLSDKDMGDAFLMPMEMFLDEATADCIEQSGQQFWLIYRVDILSDATITLRLTSDKPGVVYDPPLVT
jgi:hypothetical protein